MLVDSNDPNMYVRDIVIVFKLFCQGLPPSEIFFALLPRCCTGAAQPYTRFYVCSSSLLARSKWNINSSCQVFGLYRVEIQRPISKPLVLYIYIYIYLFSKSYIYILNNSRVIFLYSKNLYIFFIYARLLNQFKDSIP